MKILHDLMPVQEIEIWACYKKTPKSLYLWKDHLLKLKLELSEKSSITSELNMMEDAVRNLYEKSLHELRWMERL
jgi:hypothetical protein